MSDTTTPNLDLTLMDVGGDDDVWGTKNNGNFTLIDNWVATVNAQLASLQAQVSRLQTAYAAEAIGTVKWWPGRGAYPPFGYWQECDGSWFSAANFPVAFQVLGYDWGGDGQGNFAVPDLRGRVTVGFDQGSGRLQNQYGPDVPGSPGGQAIMALTAAQLPPHQHTGTTAGAGSHQHTVPALEFQGGAWVQGASGTQLNPANPATSFAPDHVHTFYTDWAGGGGAFSLCQPGALGLWIIRIQ